ncbi:sugar ABC transporter permease [Xanthobacteraceae bacterium Astr-EGSB]|uniref:carbohydrate ABC transporter permease n=1 Tax=Astrobacterium formosum TaxID=3069710 RepID=UPI0027ADA562|nr:sugar ABC transporter permease [Xanthobacteraceae bacterium Astr-EGSB]
MTAVIHIIARERVFYLFVLPFAALTILFGVWPILLSVQVSLTASASALGASPKYIGLANYVAVLADPLFVASLWRTLAYTVLSVAANLAFALAFATLLDSSLIRRGNLFFRLALFLPVITPDVAGYVVWRWLYDRSFGAINAALTSIGLPAFGGLSSPDTAMAALLIAELWHHAGFYMIIFFANLAIRDRSLEEAAHIDGATTWQRWRYVVLPQLRPALVINTVYAMIQFLKTFTVIVVMTKGGPGDRTNFVSYYAYQLFDQARYGEATAMATILFAIVIVLSLTAYKLGDREPGR